MRPLLSKRLDVRAELDAALKELHEAVIGYVSDVQGTPRTRCPSQPVLGTTETTVTEPPKPATHDEPEGRGAADMAKASGWALRLKQKIVGAATNVWRRITGQPAVDAK